MKSFIQSFLCALSLLAVAATADMVDKATGISFPTKLGDKSLFGVGVRKKGPIKIYSVGMYCSPEFQEAVASLGDAKKQAVLDSMCSSAAKSPTSFVLEMNFKVGAEKMASAIAESVAPRHSNKGDVEKFKDLIFKGVSDKGAATKGTKLQFDCSPDDGVAVTVDGKSQGSVASSGLAKAFCNVYLDNNCVSPALRDSCVESASSS